MAKRNEMVTEGRKAWLAPELKRIRAGAAEEGTGTIPDGGAPDVDRS